MIFLISAANLAPCAGLHIVAVGSSARLSAKTSQLPNPSARHEYHSYNGTVESSQFAMSTKRGDGVSDEWQSAMLPLCLTIAFAVLVLSNDHVSLVDFVPLSLAYFEVSLRLGVVALGALLFVELILIGVRSRFRTSPGPHLLGRLREWHSNGRIFAIAWPLATWGLLLCSFNAFKQNILPQAGFRFDPLFAQLDRALFAGQDPGRLLHEWIGSPDVTFVLDLAYHAWFVPMSFGIAIVGLINDSNLRAQYVLAFVLVWVLMGSILAYAFPAAGPCFYDALIGHDSSFRGLMDQLREWDEMIGPSRSLTALDYQEKLLELRGASTLSLGGGISAMPSVHNGLALLFAVVAWRVNRWIGSLFFAYAFVIWIGSIYLGWHYAIDGLAAAALTLLIWPLSGLLVAWSKRPHQRRQLASNLTSV